MQKVKKKLSIFLVIVCLLSLFTNVFAAETNNTTLNYNLTYNSENTVTVNTGDVITVEYNLENASASEDFSIQTVANEISFDNEFFEYLGDSQIIKGDYTATGKENVYSSGEHRVYFNGSHLNGQIYSQKQFMGSFKLKVKATTGSSVISSKKISAYDSDGKKYNLTSTNLTVFIGQAPSELYVVKYMNDGGVYKTVEIAGKMKVESSPSIPKGYTFSGWKNEDDGKIYQPGDEYNVTKDVTFTAMWNKIAEKYTLTFETNGGSNVNATNSIKENENTVVDLSQYTTTKSGYTFKGWYSDASFTNKVTSITLDSNKTIYAKWEKNPTGNSNGNTGGNSGVVKYTLSFETNGGTSVEPVSKIKNTTVDLSKYTSRKDGYSFDGWYTDKELTNKVTEVKMTNNITLYAKWVKGDNGYVDVPNYKPDIFSDDHYAYIVGRDGGYFYPNAQLTRAEAAEMFYRLLNSEVRTEAVTKENNFADVNINDWFNMSVSTLANLGVLNGRTTDTFAPHENITRAELTTIIARLSEAKYEGADMFKDVDGHWAKDNINIAASLNWVTGNDGLFRPDDFITRAEVVTLINRALNRQPESKSDLLDGMITPPDNTDENAWYYLAIQEAVNSHNFEKKADNIHEKWTELTSNPDWSNLNE